MDQIVLHVTDCDSGGVPVAISTYVRNSPAWVRHHLLAPEGAVGMLEASRFGFASVSVLPTGPLAAIRVVRRTARRLDVTIIHAHSSFAGVYVRLALRSSDELRLVYTPHCYAFERRDVSGVVRALYRVVERVLSRNLHAVAACSIGEAAASVSAGFAVSRVVHVPNVVHGLRPVREPKAVVHPALTVAMLGRLSPQKAPEAFVAAVGRLREVGLDIDAVWIGDGAPEARGLLADHGIHVTGWLPHAETASALAAADVYLHTAAWEGFPLAVLEAVAVGLPVLVRRIAAYGPSLPASLTIEGGLDALIEARIRGGARERAWRSRNHAAWTAHLVDHTPERQTERLAEVYDRGPSATPTVGGRAVRT